MGAEPGGAVSHQSMRPSDRRPAFGRTSALGSLREVLACFEVGAALGYVPPLDVALRDRIDHVLGTLVRLSGGQ